MRALLLLLFLSAATPSPADTWTLDSGPVNPARYAGVAVANGQIGLLSSPEPFRLQQTLIAGVYEPDVERGVSVILKTFNFLGLALTIDGTGITRLDQVVNFRQALDMKKAAFTTTFDYQDKATVRYTVRALRQLPFNALMEVTVTARRPLALSVTGLIEGSPVLKDVQVGEGRLAKGGPQLLAAAGLGVAGVHKVGAAQAFVFDEAPDAAPKVSLRGKGHGFDKSLTAGASYRFAIVGATMTSKQAVDPLTATQRLTQFAAIQRRQPLIEAHERAWADLWSSDILIQGDETAQRDVRSMLYHLYSFIRKGAGQSIAPMGLSSTGYSGHIFWDAELWMFPALLALKPPLAREMLDYRFARLEAARRNALEHGFRGAMFPWESADEGEEDTPVEAITGPLEHHITADIGIAAWNYYRVTRDRAWLERAGYPLIKETADFWTSRVTRNGPGHYDIEHVVGADEYAEDVNNNAFTNAAARANLAAATAAAGILGLTPNPDWEQVLENIPILQFPDGTTREHATYQGEEIKQADVILLSYPLKSVTGEEAIRRDLEYYSRRTHANGPAMTQSIAAILQARLQMPNTAYATYLSGLRPNQRPPFGVIAESANSNNPYFATGAGGFLQTLLYGFGGLDITDSGIQQLPTRLPQGWKSLTMTGIGPDQRTFGVK